jgi:glycosyltransferase involved in cell wall biosynthesis
VPRVLVDATAVPGDRGGVGRYVDNLLAALARGGADLAVACQRSDAERYGRLPGSVEVVPGPPAISHRPARLAWEQTGLPLVASQVGADLVHSPYYTMPLRAGRPVVVTLHDVTWFTEPEVHSAVRASFFRSATRTAVRRASRCIVPSAATRDAVVGALSATADAVDVVPHGVDPAAFHVPDDGEKARVQSRLGLDGQPWIAFLGLLEPRRNVPALVRAWAQACADRPDAPALVLAGGVGWDDEVDTAVAQVPSHLRVLRPGFLRISDLPGFLGGAVLVAYPSLGEGFGLPVLEAMACGAAVLTTPRTALPEVGGDAVAYAEPDVDSLAAALTALLDDPDRRAALGAAASERAAGFTWEACAQAHLEAYERAVRAS